MLTRMRLITRCRSRSCCWVGLWLILLFDCDVSTGILGLPAFGANSACVVRAAFAIEDFIRTPRVTTVG